MTKSLLALATFAVLFTACKKERVEPCPKPIASNNHKSTARAVGGLRYYDRWANLCIWLKTGNCLPDVVITAPRMLYMETMISGGPEKIGEYFSSSDGIALATDIGLSEELRQLLASRTYNIIIRRSDVATNKSYYLAGPAETLTLDSPDFVMEIDTDR